MGRAIYIHWPAWSFVAANIFDAATTYVLLAGGGRELNPLLATSMETYGLIPTLTGKVLLASMLAYHFRRANIRLLVLVSIVLTMLATFNALGWLAFSL